MGYVSPPPGTPVVHLPDGTHVAVADPDRPGVLTAWQVASGGVLCAYPAGIRWAPRCPSFAELPQHERRDARNAWYQGTYWPWRLRLIAAVDADRVGAQRRFGLAYPEVAAAQLRRDRDRAKAAGDLVASELLAVLYQASGDSVSAVGERLGVSWRVARDRIAAGRARWEAEPAAARATLIEHFASVGPVGVGVGALVDRLALAAGFGSGPAGTASGGGER